MRSIRTGLSRHVETYPSCSQDIFICRNYKVRLKIFSNKNKLVQNGSWQREIDIMGAINHNNVLRFIAADVKEQDYNAGWD